MQLNLWVSCNKALPVKRGRYFVASHHELKYYAPALTYVVAIWTGMHWTFPNGCPWKQLPADLVWFQQVEVDAKECAA